MEKGYIRSVISQAVLLGLPLVYGPAALAAKPVNLSHQSPAILQSFISSPSLSASQQGVQLKEISKTVDFNKTAHVRIQEMFAGYPVWGADAVMHIPNGGKSVRSLTDAMSAAKAGHASMNGTLYQDLNADLANSSAVNEVQAQQAVSHAIEAWQHKIGASAAVSDKQSSPMVFIDKNNKAHWAYRVSFEMAPVKEGAMPSKPVYILDAKTFEVYAQWNDIKTMSKQVTAGGGYGGNLKMGKMVYDGGANHLPVLNVTRDDETKTCFLKNDDVTVKHAKNNKVATYSCKAADPEHSNLFWDADLDMVNNGYSPDNDALFGGAVIKDMYQKWYGVPVLTDEQGKPLMLTMVVHAKMDNAYWDGSKMTFGDGINMFYPLTSLGVASHEISHGFTEQHSNLAYYGQSGGMNEAFSDMAAQAAEFYAYGKNSWQIGPEIFKAENEALRYMDKPSKDCNGNAPGQWCSIDEVSQYDDGLDVHFSSGIYNRTYYLIGTSEGWDPRKAFDVMVKANSDYWTSRTTFAEGACGVLKAAKDYKYDTAAIVKAFSIVGIDTSEC